MGGSSKSLFYCYLKEDLDRESVGIYPQLMKNLFAAEIRLRSWNAIDSMEMGEHGEDWQSDSLPASPES